MFKRVAQLHKKDFKPPDKQPRTHNQQTFRIRLILTVDSAICKGIVEQDNDVLMFTCILLKLNMKLQLVKYKLCQYI